MRKKLFFMLALICVAAFFSLDAANMQAGSRPAESTFVFPASLKEIEEEAFFGTAVQTAVFPEGFRIIGDRAFENAYNLRNVYISPSTEYISEGSFPSNPSFAIHGAEGSPVQEWAKEHEISFVADNIWQQTMDHGRQLNGQALGIGFFSRATYPDKDVRTFPRAADNRESKRPQDRPELNPINYRFP